MTSLIRELDRNGFGDTVPPDLQSWHIGADGEVLVGQELARLSSEWRVLHSVPVGQVADIDHLVIGPPGVFVLNTKHHAGKRVSVGTHVVWINGVQEPDYQRRLGDRAAKVRGAIGGDAVPDLLVQPLLVFVGAQRFMQSGEQTVESVQMSNLVAYLASRPARLTPSQVADLHDLAARPVTWGRSASVLHEPDPTARFLRLVRGAPTPVRTPARHMPAHRRPMRIRRSSGVRQVGAGCLAIVLAATVGPVVALLSFGLFTHLLQALVAR